jgi:hypothetical protein
MKITAVVATPLYAPRWLPYTDEDGLVYGGTEGRAGSDGRPSDQDKKRRQLAGKESRGGVIVIETDGPLVGLGEVSTCWTPDGVEQCRCVTEQLAALVVRSDSFAMHSSTTAREYVTDTE